MKFPKSLQFTLCHAHKLPFCAQIDSVGIFLENQAKHLNIGEQTSNSVVQDSFAISKGAKDQYNSEIVI